MDTKICLDSNIIISILRKDEKILHLIQQRPEQEFVTTTINYFEIWGGRKEKEHILNILQTLTPLSFTSKASLIAGDIQKNIMRKGEMLEIRDIFIASICIENNIPLLTNNKKHFERLQKYGLRLA